MRPPEDRTWEDNIIRTQPQWKFWLARLFGTPVETGEERFGHHCYAWRGRLWFVNAPQPKIMEHNSPTSKELYDMIDGVVSECSLRELRRIKQIVDERYEYERSRV